MRTAIIELRFAYHQLATVEVQYIDYLPSAVCNLIASIMNENTRQSASKGNSGQWQGNRSLEYVQWRVVGEKV